MENIIGPQIEKSEGWFKMLKAKDVMQMLNISRPTIYRLAESGELPAIRVGRGLRFREEDMVEYLERQRVKKKVE